MDCIKQMRAVRLVDASDCRVAPCIPSLRSAAKLSSCISSSSSSTSFSSSTLSSSSMASSSSSALTSKLSSTFSSVSSSPLASIALLPASAGRLGTAGMRVRSADALSAVVVLLEMDDSSSAARCRRQPTVDVVGAVPGVFRSRPLCTRGTLLPSRDAEPTSEVVLVGGCLFVAARWYWWC